MAELCFIPMPNSISNTYGELSGKTEKSKTIKIN